MHVIPFGKHSNMPLIQLDDMAALKARVPSVGEVAWIPHHTTSGDGGGGFFEAVDTSATGDTDVPDQGIFIVADSHRTTVSDETVTASFGSGGQTLNNNPIVSGTMTMTLTSTAVCTDMFLHGHTFAAGTANPWLDYSAGTINEQGLTLLTNATGATVDITYDYASSTLRWKRVWDGRIVDLRWWAPAKTNAAAIADRNLLCWALEHANRLGAKAVVLNCDIYQHGTIEIPSGMELWGAEHFGLQNKMTVVDTIAQEWAYVTVPTSALHDLTMGPCTILSKSNATKNVFRRLERDGNYTNNTVAWDTPATISGGAAQNLINLRDTPSWCGFASTDHNGRTLNSSFELELEDCHFHNFGGHILITSGHAWTKSDRCRFGNGVFGRPMYTVQGIHRDTEIYGYSHGEYVRVSPGSQFYNVRVHNLAANPQDATLKGPIFSNGGVWSLDDFAADAVRQRGVLIDNFYIDCGGHHITNVFWFSGQGAYVTNGTIRTSPNAGVNIFGGNPNRLTGTAWWHRGGIYSNIAIEMRESCNLFGSATQPMLVDNLVVENIDVRQALDVADKNFGVCFGYWICDHVGDAGTSHASVLATEPTHRFQNTFRNINFQVPVGSLLWVDIVDPNVKVDLHFDKIVADVGTFEADRPFRVNPGGNPDVASLTNSTDLDAFRCFWENSLVRLTANITGSNSELALALSRYRNCEDPDGRRSDEGGLYEPALAVGGEDFVDIQTAHWHTPREIKVEGIGQDMEDAGIARVEAVDSGGTTLDPDDVTSHEHDPLIRVHFTNALNVNDVIKIRWRSSVRPFESS